jgi:hypothetical protein
VLDEAVRYFGVKHGDTSPLRPIEPAGAHQAMLGQPA